MRKKMEEVNIRIYEKDIDKISKNKEEWSVLRVEKMSSKSKLLTYEEAVYAANSIAKVTGDTDFLVYVNSDNTEEVLNFKEFKSIEK